MNYIIDGFDFFAELKKEHVAAPNEAPNEAQAQAQAEQAVDDNPCLITNEPLIKYNIELICGHKFNYIPLFKEVRSQKNLKRFRSHANRLRINEFQCPFCRTTQTQLLPFIHELDVYQCIGVNSPKRYCMFITKCNWIMKSGARKGQQCDVKCNNTHCDKHSVLIEHHETVGKGLASTSKCVALLKTGKNKGLQCAHMAFENDLCKRHSKK